MSNATDLQKTVLAGERIMYDKTVFETFKAGLMNPGPLPQKLATEAAGLIKIMNEHAKPGIPPAVIIPAATMLLMEMASFMAKAGMAQPSKQDVAAGIKLLVAMLLKLYGAQPAPVGQAPAVAAPQPAPAPAGGMIAQI